MERVGWSGVRGKNDKVGLNSVNAPARERIAFAGERDVTPWIAEERRSINDADKRVAKGRRSQRNSTLPRFIQRF
jgi:hypothetical protein